MGETKKRPTKISAISAGVEQNNPSSKNTVAINKSIFPRINNMVPFNTHKAQLGHGI